MNIVFLRRRNLGRGSISGMSRYAAEQGYTFHPHKTWKNNPMIDADLVVRWGCTAENPYSGVTVLNDALSIHRVNDKKGFRFHLQNHHPTITPETFDEEYYHQSMPYPLVVRPSRHAQGRHLWVVNDVYGLNRVTAPLEDWYASRLVEKAAEYRVYVVGGRVATVAQKTPQDPSQVAWNVAQGGRFDVVRWGNWNLDVCKAAVDAFNVSGLDFGGVDVMVEKGTNKPYILEINSAPSLPKLSDERHSYRQQVMAKCFIHILEHGKDVEPVTQYFNWRDLIHPAIYQGE